MTVETRWSGLTVTDWLDKPARETTPDDSPAVITGDSTLVRVLTGSGKAKVEFAPRPEFGQVAVQLQPIGDGLLVLGSNEPVALYAPGVEWEVGNDGGYETAKAIVDLSAAGGQVVLELRFGTHSLEHHRVPIHERQAAAEQPWKDWVASLRLPSIARDLVARSASPCVGSATKPPARSWPRRPPRSPRSWAGSVTGTTATAGCATPR